MSTKNAIDPVAQALFPKARREVLALLFGHPGEAFYLREVVQRTGLGQGSVQRELDRLVRGGLLLRSERGRHVYFEANAACAAYEELRGLIAKTMGTVARLRAALSSLVRRIDVAFVYGSVAQGRESAASDLDLLVIGDVSLSEVVRAIRPVQRELGREVTPVVYSRAEATAGSRRHFLGAVLRGPKLFVVGGDRELERLPGERLGASASDVTRGDP